MNIFFERRWLASELQVVQVLHETFAGSPGVVQSDRNLLSTKLLRRTGGTLDENTKIRQEGLSVNHGGYVGNYQT